MAVGVAPGGDLGGRPDPPVPRLQLGLPGPDPGPVLGRHPLDQRRQGPAGLGPVGGHPGQVPAGVGVLGLDGAGQGADRRPIGQLDRVEGLAQLLGPAALGREGGAQVVGIAQQLGVGGVGLLQLSRPQPQEPQPVGGQGGPGGQQLDRGQVLAAERPGGPAQGQHPDGPALDHHGAPGLGVARPGAELAAWAGPAPARPGHQPAGLQAAGLQQDHALGRLKGLAGALQQGGAGRGQVLAARQDPERGPAAPRRREVAALGPRALLVLFVRFETLNVLDQVPNSRSPKSPNPGTM